MGLMYDDPEYAASRLNGTIVFYEGMPAYVDCVHSNSEVSIQTKQFGDYFSVNMDELDLTPPSLGFINRSKDCVYLSRYPGRQWKQGFRTSQVSYNPNMNVLSTAFKNTFLGKYPSIFTCVENVMNKEKESQAFSRYFNLSRVDNELLMGFKEETVAKINPQQCSNIQPEFIGEYNYLTELFEETMENN